MMINFGTSAYIKLLALNNKPQASEIRKRSKPDGNGYDFHRAMRRTASRHGAGKITISEALQEISHIKKDAERKSAAEAINQLIRWRRDKTLFLHDISDERWKSPNDIFSVKFSADFWYEEDGKKILTHLWNTKFPDLSGREAYGTLGLFTDRYGNADIAVLCLRKRKLYRLESSENATKLANILANAMENRILSLGHGDGSAGSATGAR